jgi:hypothetical protein
VWRHGKAELEAADGEFTGPELEEMARETRKVMGEARGTR